MKQLVVLLLCCLPLALLSQTGGRNVFPFLNLPYNARSAALGRKFITAYDEDINLVVQNPAMLNAQMNNSFGVSQALLAGGINHGMAIYGKTFDKIGTGAVHLRYVAYGKMDRMNKYGEKIGTFSAGDFVAGVSFGRSFSPNFSIGATFNLIWSQLETYSSMGVALDLAGMYHSSNDLTTVSVVVRNAGIQLKTYTKKTRSPLPVDLMIGVGQRLPHSPFRFSVVMHRLNTWDLSYNDPNAEPTTDPLTGELVQVEKASFFEKFGRHFIFQMEALIGDVVRVRAAFDYNQRQEMLVQNRPGMGGFSFGAGLNFKRFSVDYGLVIYSSAGFQNVLSLRTDFDKWRN